MPFKRIWPGEPRYLYEQDGVTERLLKSELVKLFRARRAVERAYLVRVDYGDPEQYNVLLALVCSEDEQRLTVRDVSRVVERNLASGLVLDIGFLTEQSEPEVQAVAKPFFDRHQPI